MKVGLHFADDAMPRTVFYDRLVDAIRAHPSFCTDPGAADLIVPIEDTAMETNWPRYGKPRACFIRGSFSNEAYREYSDRVAGSDVPVCILTMHPQNRITLTAAHRTNVIVADVNLVTWKRALNPRTISMPALPFMVGDFDPAAKTVLASFRGAETHYCRTALATIADGKSIIVELPETRHQNLDAEARLVDTAYTDLLHRSVFAFVPRGDTEFTYRLLEVMSFGCIPVVLADGQILPFDRTIDWDNAAVRLPERQVARIPALLAEFGAERIATMQRTVVDAYRRHLADFPAIAGTLLSEAGGILGRSIQDRNRAAAAAPRSQRAS